MNVERLGTGVYLLSRLGRYVTSRWATLQAVCAMSAFGCVFSVLELNTAHSEPAMPRRVMSEADGPIASPEPDWPQWRGPQRNGITEETGLLTRWPETGPKLLWQKSGLGEGWSSAIVAAGRLIITGDIGEDLVIHAFGLDGRELWKATNGRAWSGSYPGARSTCAYSQGYVYHLNAHGRLVCLEGASGKEVWCTDVLTRFGAKNITWGISECLLVDGDRVIVTPGGRQALMAALDKRNGETVWETPPLSDDRTSYSSPLLFRHQTRRLIANCSSAHGFGVDADTGRLLWTVALKNQFDVNVSTPEYGDGCVFYVTPYGEEGRLYRLRGSDGGIEAELVWQNDLDTVTGSGVRLGDTLFVAGYKRSKWWFSIDWKTGKPRSELKTLTTGAAVYAEGRLYCLDERGTVALADTAHGRLELVSHFSLVERVRDAWAHPVIHQGRLYLRYADRLWCYDVRSTL